MENLNYTELKNKNHFKDDTLKPKEIKTVQNKNGKIW
jgi:hypothetical protein